MADVCRSCKAPVLWVTMIGSGKPNPLDPAPDPKGNILVVAGAKRQRLGLMVTSLRDDDVRVAAEAAGASRYLSHFATCPDREHHRRTDG